MCATLCQWSGSRSLVGGGGGSLYVMLAISFMWLGATCLSQVKKPVVQAVRQ